MRGIQGERDIGEEEAYQGGYIGREGSAGDRYREYKDV